MATRKQEVTHAIAFFFHVWCVKQFCKVWFPTENFFRKLWWRAWGHNPKTPEFHLSKMTFDKSMSDRITISAAVHLLAQNIYGDAYHSSPAWRQFNLYSRFCYQRYDEWSAITDLWTHKKPGQAIIDWFCKVEGMSSERFKAICSVRPGLQEHVDKILEDELHIVITR
jgi:hypothetical protein